MPYLFVIGIGTSDPFCGIYILFGSTFSFFSVFWLVYIETSWKILKLVWGFKFLTPLKFLIIFLLAKKMLCVMILTWVKYCEEQIMYLVYIYNSFVLNVLLTFFYFLTFIYEVIRFKLVLGYLCGKIQELYLSGKTC